MLDREDALAQVADAVERACAGRGALLLIEGAAGTGKSSLLAAAGELGSSQGMHTLRARAAELEREHPFGVARQLFEPVLARAGAAERDDLLRGAAAPAAGILDLAGSLPGAQAAGFITLHAFHWLTANLSQRAPLLLAVDDLHWADPSSLRMLDYLCRRLAELPVALVAALRPEEPGVPETLVDAIRTAPGLAGVRLAPLHERSVAAIVRGRYPGADARVCEAFARATAGNPLMLQELLRSFAGDDAAPAPEDVHRATLPSLGQRILRRAAQVGEQAPSLLRSMALLDDGARLATAAALAGLDASEAAQLAHRLRRIEVLSAEDPVVFVHPLLRRSLLDDMPAAERRRGHEAAARTLEAEGAPPERVAAHLSTLPPAGSSWVATGLAAAAERALDRAAPDEAVHWLERALAEQAPVPPEAELTARLADAKTLLRDPTAIPLLRRAFEQLDDPHRRAETAVALAYALAAAGEWPEAIAFSDRARGELPDTEPAVVADLAGLQAGLELYDPALSERFEPSRRFYEQVAAGDSWGARAMAALLAADAAQRGRLDEGQRWLRHALRDGRLLGERGAGGWAAGQLLLAAMALDDVADTSVLTAEIHAAARSQSSVLTLWASLAFDCWRSSRRGDLTAAEADLLTILSFSQVAAVPMARGNVAFISIDVMLERPTVLGLAREIEVASFPPALLETWSGANLLEARGCVRVALGDRAAGIADLRAAGRIAATLGFGPWVTTWRSALALALPAEERDEALTLAREEHDLGVASGLPRPAGISLRTLGLLAAETEERLALLRESVRVLEGSPARLELARSLVALGGVVRRARRRREAREPLEAGYELARACGAQRLVERARQELLAAGGRTARHDPAMRDALTASERRVAELAVAGASNAEIAQTLFVSLKTVETHLSHVYAKLGLTGPGSRGRLQEILVSAAGPSLSAAESAAP